MRMRTTVAVAALAFALLGALAAPGRAATQVERRRAENERWRKAAEDLQERYQQLARRHEADGDFARAIAYYRRVMSVYYHQWEFGRIGREDDGPKTASRRKRRYHLRGSRYNDAARRIENLQTRRVEMTLDAIEELARDAGRQNESVREYSLYRRLLAAAERVSDRASERYATRARSRLQTIERAALRDLSRIEQRLRSERTVEQAVEHFLEFEERYGSFAISPTVHEAYTKLTENPVLLKHKGAVEAGQHLDQALDYLENEQHPYAYYEFMLVVEQFPETEVAQTARGHLEDMENDPRMFRRIHEVPRDRYADELLRRAVERMEDNDLISARRMFDHIAANFPGTLAARHAQSRLRLMDRLAD